MSIHNIDYLDNKNLCVPHGLLTSDKNLFNNIYKNDFITINDNMLKDDIYSKLLDSVKYNNSDICDSNCKKQCKKSKKKERKNKKSNKKSKKNI